MSELKGKKEPVENLLTRKYFLQPSFNIYEGQKGFFDLGPPGCAVKNNIIGLWRKAFVQEEDILEIECPIITPHVCLETSGHVEKFTDLMTQDVVTKECYRVDHLLEGFLEKEIASDKVSPEKKSEYESLLSQVGGLNYEQMGAHMRQFKLKSANGNDLSDPYPFNLMFQTSVGPAGDKIAYLRPETAQGIFLNFRKAMEYNGSRLPFGIAQIGSAYRNEIAPRHGLLRVREFTLAEVEYFLGRNGDTSVPDEARYGALEDLKLSLHSIGTQKGNKSPLELNVKEAYDQKIIVNRTLLYFIAKTSLFLTEYVGLKKEYVRFRQHLENELAHYASDCWDAESLTSYGWIEIVGLADRSTYDLEAHDKRSNVDLCAQEVLKEPKIVKEVKIVPQMRALGPRFGAKTKAINERLGRLTECERNEMKKELEEKKETAVTVGEEKLILSEKEVKVVLKDVKITTEKFYPRVVEPSFGIGRIMYSLFEHVHWMREDDEQRNVLSFNPLVAPWKVALLTLSKHEDLVAVLPRIKKILTTHGYFPKLDDSSGSIGRKYSRLDELGVPFCVTIDFKTVEEAKAEEGIEGVTVTLRERDSTGQIRQKLGEVVSILDSLCSSTQQKKKTWAEVYEENPMQSV